MPGPHFSRSVNPPKAVMTRNREDRALIYGDEARRNRQSNTIGYIPFGAEID
jgi:hypothetical protein